MKKTLFICLLITLFMLGGIIYYNLYLKSNISNQAPQTTEANIPQPDSEDLAQTPIDNIPVNRINDVNQPKPSDIGLQIIYKPVLLTDYRKQLAREYAQMHYGEPFDTIIPQAIVIHWTASNSMQAVYNYFYGEEASTDREYGKLNLTSHYLVDRDGTIYQLTPETNLNRHAIGLNWCSIGIENVGGVNGNQDLTDAQLESNEKIVRHLTSNYPSIKYLLGHYQQDRTKKAGLWKENISEYYADKPDPGPVFMQSLINKVNDLKLVTFPIIEPS